jgi:hypothetical protein
MAGCHSSVPAERRSFVVTAYVAAEDGKLVARMPDEGPCARRDDRACVVGVHHLRSRKTGPCHPLMVMTCQTHGLGFTLYPYGHVPYGRLEVAPAAPDGEVLCEPKHGAEAFGGTLFTAALDASVGVAWPREKPGGSERWWGGQGRHLETAVRVCGVSPALGEKAREAEAEALGIPLLCLREGAQAIVETPGYRSRGRAVRSVLNQLEAGPCVLWRLLASGKVAGVWGAAYEWDAKVGRLRLGRFQRTGTDPT